MLFLVLVATDHRRNINYTAYQVAAHRGKTAVHGTGRENISEQEENISEQEENISEQEEQIRTSRCTLVNRRSRLGPVGAH